MQRIQDVPDSRLNAITRLGEITTAFHVEPAVELQ